MADTKILGWSRRDFVKTVGAAALATGVTTGRSRPARAQKKTLKIAQWSHFVPDYDKWFDDVYTKEWGERTTPRSSSTTSTSTSCRPRAPPR
jgi:multiple sugar transport system substrate-binding protein